MKISTLEVPFSKMDKNKCPFSENGGRDLKKTMHSSLRA
jgi:hypothetical protein